MFKLIQWSAIIIVVVAIFYGASFVWEMNDVEREEVKTGARDAFESTVMSNLLAERIKADLAHKKAKLLDRVRDFLKEKDR